MVKTNSTCFLPGLLALAMFWGIVSQTYCRIILEPLPERPTITALNHLLNCLKHILSDLIHMSVLLSIVILVDAMLDNFLCFNCMYQHLVNWISSYLLTCATRYNVCMYGYVLTLWAVIIVVSMINTPVHVLSSGWPLCKRSDLTLIEVSEHAYLSYQAFSLFLVYHHVDYCKLM